jgi:adenine-specific DNA-methyltransferase
MPAAIDSRHEISEALKSFSNTPLRQASTEFLKKLGYASSRTLPTDSVEDFCRQFDAAGLLDHPSALKSDWKSIDLLFQLTDEDISVQDDLFDAGEVQPSLLKSYLFFAVELTGDHYARGKLTALARQINRLFPMPVMVLIKHLADKKEVLSIAVINRRQNQRDASKDVLGKVTIIRDISLFEPHRGHLDILASFSRENLVHPKKEPINSFDALHAAWEQIFNVDLLNERFYKELSNWYFWALPQVEFPDDLEKDAEKRRATGLIRLLTRLIFCWFLKEKGLIPERLFHPADLAKVLKGFDPESETSSTFYLAILQNLFFATLNQRMGKDSKGDSYRFFATDEGFKKNRDTYDVNNLYRYENLFTVSQEEALALFADIPFLNGGLFECLDRTEEGTNKKRYLDGFSRNTKKRPHVPDRLFFDSGETADLSEAYGDKKRKAEKVTGLISILNRYKFTIIENTPIDQEIALDPELLGKVFENLLASYNEETKTTARKQTGSFYTPRPIVEYMVDESLKAHLSSILMEKAGMKEGDAEAGLELLFTYTSKEHPFSEREVAVLITAIDEVKILDPACGSGAFPMGVLHKLVYILAKLDPDNERWKLTQLAKLDSATMRDALEAAFDGNNDDYGRKLHLIENCLYGLDIQPIAIQITKLRFFISLVCDQRTNRDKAKNHGIRPLPNLETKFVAANTLIGLPIPEPDLFIRNLIEPIEKEIEQGYHSHFSIQRREQKLALQKRIKNLRQTLSDTLLGGLGANKNSDVAKKARLLADWDAFDPQASADFFDPHWTFGKSLSGGFDIVIGNPPYGCKIPKELHHTLEKQFRSWGHRGESYILFIEKALNTVTKQGVVTLIVPDTFTNLKFTASIRAIILNHRVIFIDSLPSSTFESAVVDTALLSIRNVCGKTPYTFCSRQFTHDGSPPKASILPSSNLTEQGFNISLKAEHAPLIHKLGQSGLSIGAVADVFYGIKAYQAGKGKPPQTRDTVTTKPFTSAHKMGADWLPFFDGKDIARYASNWHNNNFIKYGPWLAEPRQPRKFEGEKLLVRKIFGETLIATYVAITSYCNTLLFVVKPRGERKDYDCHLLLGIITSKLMAWFIKAHLQISSTDLFPQIMVADIESLPLPAEPNHQDALALKRAVKKRIAENVAGFTLTDAEIDQQVYALYRLTPQEISIVEGGAP